MPGDFLNIDHERLDNVVRKVEVHHELLSTMTIQVQEIHDALLGDFNKEGIVSRVRNLERTSKKRRTPEWLEHAFKAVTAAMMAYLGIRGVE
jgi:hypothetical protein